MQELTSSVRIGRYQVDHIIGAGGLSKVYLLMDPATQEKAALKVYEEYASTTYLQRVINSVNTSMRLSGLDYFPKFYSAGILDNVACTFEDSIARLLKNSAARKANYIMMEYIGEINVREFINDYWKAKTESSSNANSSLSPADVNVFLRIMRNCACAYNCMHNLRIVHADAKPSNIMLPNIQSQDQKVIILDFDLSFTANPELIYGFSLLLHQKDISSTTGTLLFQAPETLSEEDIGHTQYSDVWGLGCTFYKILRGTLPFESTSISGIRWAIKHAEPKKLASEVIDEKISALVHSCLEKDWKNRPNATQLKEGLEEIMRGKGVSY